MKNQEQDARKTLFVSRQLEADSTIIEFCAEWDIQLIHESLLSFSEVPFDSLPTGDWLFFYSKSGVKFFLKQQTDLKHIANYKIACYGPSTAKVWQTKTDMTCQFVGNGKPEDVPEEFLRHIQNKETVVFIRAMHSKMAVQKHIENQVNCKDVIAYKNSRRTDIVIPQSIDYAMLTSPMNADAFIEEIPDYAGPIITLGTTTSKHLLRHYDLKSIAAEEITESGMLAKLSEYLLRPR